jgi:hypothetical protein
VGWVGWLKGGCVLHRCTTGKGAGVIEGLHVMRHAAKTTQLAADTQEPFKHTQNSSMLIPVVRW